MHSAACRCVCTLWGVRSVVIFCFLFFWKFHLPIGLHNSCSIRPTAGGTCQKCSKKFHNWVDAPQCMVITDKNRIWFGEKHILCELPWMKADSVKKWCMLQSLVPGPRGPLVRSRVAGVPATGVGSAASMRTPQHPSEEVTTHARGRSTSRSRATMTGYIQFNSSTLSQGFKDEDLGNSPSWWAATVATYCQSRHSQLLATAVTKHCDWVDE